MPSDAQTMRRAEERRLLERALEALAGPVDDFRSSVARAVDEIRSQVASRSEPAGGDRMETELGPMARGRIDSERFAAIFAGTEALDPGAVDVMREALEVLSELDAGGDDLFVHEVGPGGSLRDEVAGALARLGRAFGAARSAELARTGQFRREDHGSYLDAFPHEMWNAGERGIAPPLVVRLRGEELQAAGLAEFLTGGQKLVLVVEPPAPPASLVRLITPGVLVMQTDDPGRLERAVEADGPAVAALFPEGSRVARFVHDPAAGSTLAARLTVGDGAGEGPEGSRRIRPVGTVTVEQQSQELEQLAALAELSRTPPAASEDGAGPPEGAGGEVEPADRLAAWLLRQANLRDVG